MQNFLHRQEQIALLRTLIGQNGSQMQALFVYGVTGTGKTAVVRSIIEQPTISSAFIDCLEAFTPKFLFETILNQLSNTLPSPENEFKGYTRCEHISEFVRHLSVVIDSNVIS